MIAVETKEDRKLKQIALDMIVHTAQVHSKEWILKLAVWLSKNEFSESLPFLDAEIPDFILKLIGEE